MSCGVGIIHGKASLQNFNTKRTTESEMDVVSDYVPYKIHMISFLGQGYALNKKVLYQDKKMQLRQRRTAEIHAQVIKGTFPSGIFLLRIMWIRSILVSNTETHRRCSLTSSLIY